MKAYVDVGRRKAHTVCFPVSGQTVRLERLIELLNYAVTAVYVDALFPSVLADLYELAKNGVKVYHLRRLCLFSILRKKLELEKTDEGDAKLLASIPTDEFNQLTEPRIRLRMLINEYYAIADTLRQVKQRVKITTDGRLRDTKKFLERQHNAIEKETTEQAEQSLPQYSMVGESLGLKGVSLVALLTYVDFGQGFDKILRQAGRTNNHKKTRKFSRRAMRALNGLSAHVVRHSGERYGQLYQYHLGILRSRKKALLRVQTWLLKDIHRIVTGRPLPDTPTPSG